MEFSAPPVCAPLRSPDIKPAGAKTTAVPEEVDVGASLKDFISAAALKRVRKAKGVMHRLPGVGFRSPEFLRLEFDRWLSQAWLFVGRGADLPNPGDFQCLPVLVCMISLNKWQSRMSIISVNRWEKRSAVMLK